VALSLPVMPKPSERPMTLVSGPARQANGRMPVRLAALRVPLAAKVLGANGLVVALFVAAWLMAGGPVNAAVIAVIAIALGVYLTLVMIALRPIRDLEAVAARVWQGDLGARVERSSVADTEVLRVGSMFNILLDGLASDRAQMRALAAEVIAAGDRERAAVAKELHDSIAQHIAALLLQLSVAAREAPEPELAARLYAARESAEAILEEVRHLSHVVHPALLDALGLEAALRKLARDASHGTGIDIDVDVKNGPKRLPTAVEGALYRVAEEAVRNAIRHADARRVQITLFAERPSVTLEVHDDGRGFDLAAADRRPTGAGLLSMRERIALIDGSLAIKTAPGGGTTVAATVPLDISADAVH
jgi:signal transduction histidine kinase